VLPALVHVLVGLADVLHAQRQQVYGRVGDDRIAHVVVPFDGIEQTAGPIPSTASVLPPAR